METPTALAPRETTNGAERIARIPTIYWLAAAILLYAAVSFAFSWLRALNFGTSTWDLGIYQQALWSTAHGRPFWETADYETGGFSSLLQVHSVFLLYLLVPLYAALPSSLTLFAVQSAVVALAALPLYLLARDLTGSGRWALLAAVAYLLWTPTLASNLYDFHAESFLPLEVFTVVLLWQRGRYGWGFLVAGFSYLTFELGPVLLAFVGLMYFLPESPTLARWMSALRRGRGRGTGSEVRGWFASRRALASMTLLIGSVVAYGLLVLVRQDYLSGWLGIGAYPPNPFGYVVGTTPAGLQLSASYLGVAFGTKVESWLVFFALLGFVPFLAPRTLLLSVPWLVFSFFSDNANYVALGFQYGFIIGSGLLIGFAFGLVPIARWAEGRPRRSERTPDASEIEVWARAVSARGGRRRRRATVVVAAFGVLVAANIALSPADPLLYGAAYGSAYSFSYTPPPGYGEVVKLAGLVPAGAYVLASDDVFPFVANDVNAYSLLYEANQRLLLPFNATDEPPFVLLSVARTDLVPTWLEVSVYDPEVYGVRGIAWSTPAGAVVLFERGYTGPALSYGAPSGYLGTFYGAAPPASGVYSGAIYTGDSGYVADLAGDPGGGAVVSTPGLEGLVGSGPGVNLPAGNYTVLLGVSTGAWDAASPPAPDDPVLTVNANLWGQPTVYDTTFSYAELRGGSGPPGWGPWTTVGFNLTVTEPSLTFEMRGYSLDVSAVVAMGWLTIAPA